MPEPEKQISPMKATTSGSEPPPPVDDSFDLLAFWIEYRKLIMWLITLVSVGLIAWGGYELWQYRKRSGSSNAFGAANTTEDFRKVIAEWDGTPAAGSALLRIGEELRKEGKYDEAINTLNDFTKKYSNHSLSVGGILSLGFTQELAGKTDEALATYQRLQNNYAESAFAPIAALSQARIYKSQNKIEEARKALAAFDQKYKSTPFASEAQRMIEDFDKAEGRAIGGTPRPTPPAPPTPPAAPTPTVPPGIQITPTPTAEVVPPSPAPSVPSPAAPVPTPVTPPTPGKP
jgi:tetratricopeptide (TPR) repeat protein